jgi:hypothetical protein
MIYIGIDNGVSGSIGQISPHGVMYVKMPVIKQLNYTKTKKWIHRVDYKGLKFILESNLPEEMIVYLERPMVNPGRFQATASAIRALEATLIVLEELKIPYQYIDSKEWQKVLLPAELKGEELKDASLDIGKRKFPKIDFKGFKDADGLLIAEYCRIKNSNGKEEK